MTVDYKIDATDVNKAMALLERYPQVAGGVVVPTMTETVKMVEANVKRQFYVRVPRGRSGVLSMPVDQGTAVGAVMGHVEVIGGGAGKIGGNVRGIVDHRKLAYMPVLELGRRPGSWLPTEPILRWVHLKLRPPENEERSITFLIRRSIYRRGTEGYFMFARGWEASKQWVSQRWQKALHEITERLAIHG